MQMDPFKPFLKLEQLQDISGGDMMFERELIELYATEFMTTIDKLKSALFNTDTVNITLLSHDMKGSSSNIGAEAVRRVTEQMEMLAKDGRFAEVAALLPVVIQVFEKTVQLYAEYFAKVPLTN